MSAISTLTLWHWHLLHADERKPEDFTWSETASTAQESDQKGLGVNALWGQFSNNDWIDRSWCISIPANSSLSWDKSGILYPPKLPNNMEQVLSCMRMHPIACLPVFLPSFLSLTPLPVFPATSIQITVYTQNFVSGSATVECKIRWMSIFLSPNFEICTYITSCQWDL